jgi:hypothetical protein
MDAQGILGPPVTAVASGAREREEFSPNGKFYPLHSEVSEGECFLLNSPTLI